MTYILLHMVNKNNMFVWTYIGRYNISYLDVPSGYIYKEVTTETSTIRDISLERSSGKIKKK